MADDQVSLHNAQSAQSTDTISDLQYTLAAVIKSLPFAVIVTDINGRIIYVNKAIEENTGYLSSELIGKFPDFFDAEEKALFIQQEIMEYLQQNKKWQGKILQRRKDGSTYLSEFEIFPVLEEARAIVWVSLQRDITEQKRAEEKLKYQVEFQKLMASISSGFVNVTPAETDMEINEALRLIGEFAGADRSYIFLLTDEGRKMDNTHEWCAKGIKPQINMLKGLSVAAFPWFMNKLNQFKKVHVPYVDELPGEAALEKEILQVQDVQSMVVVPMVYNKILLGFLGFDAVRVKRYWSDEVITLLEMAGDIFINAIRRKESEEELRQSEELFAKAFNAIPGAMAIVSVLEDTIIDANRASLDMVGLMHAEVIGKNIRDMNLWVDLEERARIIQVVLEQGAVYNKQINYYNATGEICTGLYSAATTRVNGIDCIFGIVNDVTKLKQQEEQILFQASLLDQVRNAVIATDMQGKIIYWNNFAESLYQWKSEEVAGRDLVKMIACESKHLVQSVIEYLSDGKGYWEGEFLTQRKDGNTLPIYAVVTILKDVDGNPSGTVGVWSDLTEKKKIEAEMARLSRLNLIGEMAAGIAHEIRNPLTTVRGFLQMLGGKKENVRYKEYDELMIAELDRANAIITEFLSLAKMKADNLKRQDLNKIIEAMLPLINANAMNADKYVTVELEAIPNLLLNEKEIRQLLLNLVRNGLDAMLPGKYLTIKTFVSSGQVCRIRVRVLNLNCWINWAHLSLLPKMKVPGWDWRYATVLPVGIMLL